MTLKPGENYVVSVFVVTDDQEHAAKTAEVLARAAAGLMLDGVNINVSMHITDENQEEL